MNVASFDCGEFGKILISLIPVKSYCWLYQDFHPGWNEKVFILSFFVPRTVFLP